ncbi:dihydroorotate dehydrogenase [Alloscardovia theropitheci]|uniref:Dihydroorotate dehydrogenase n=1 Tax=Alloscardovia theropitheci TaxID=2496842 RepID=A0A4R0QQZ7_9BIFI|nr:dihydroorotate dehydrogenase [Alloscardovia theropitheci]TCD54754.1 dihydroorotate dehydrogenase [Alloscardovia theropitheci]
MFDATQEYTFTHGTVVAGVQWKSPIGTAAGTYNLDACSVYYNPAALGSVCTKGVSPVPWEGNPAPRTAETPAGTVNSVGLQNPGVDHYLEDDLPRLKAMGTTVISNVAGHSAEDFAYVVEKLAKTNVDMLEINVSCPNVKAGTSFAKDPVALASLVRQLRPLTDKPMIFKLSPNVSDIVPVAQAVVESGADAVSLINTFVGMRIDTRTGKPILANVTGGVSGPAIHPMAVGMVYKIRQAFHDFPIIAMGGTSSGEDALEFLYAGANAVEVGSAALVDPAAPVRIACELESLLDERPELSEALSVGKNWINRNE